MRPYHVAHDGETQPGALTCRLGRHPRIEQTVHDRRRNPRPRVGHFHADSRRTRCHGDRQRAAVGHGVECVGDQVEQRHLQLCRVRLDRRQISGDRGLQPDTRVRQPRLCKLPHPLDDVREVHDLEPGWLPRAVEHGAQHAGDLLDLRIDGQQPRTRPVVRARVVADHLDVTRHEVQRRARLMRDVGGGLTQRRHALGMPQRFPKCEQLVLAGCQLRIAEQEIASGLLDAVVKGLVEPLQLIEHLVQSRGDCTELVATRHRRPRAQIASGRLLHGAQNRAERLTDEPADGEVDEHRHEQNGRDREPECEEKSVRACLEETLQTHRHHDRRAPTTRHRQGEHHHRAAALAGRLFGGDGASRKLQDLHALFR